MLRAAANARAIDTAHGTERVTIDQTGGSNRWVWLGTHRFDNQPEVRLSTITPGGTGDEDIAFDAVAFVPGKYDLIPDMPASNPDAPEPAAVEPDQHHARRRVPPGAGRPGEEPGDHGAWSRRAGAEQRVEGSGHERYDVPGGGGQEEHTAVHACRTQDTRNRELARRMGGDAGAPMDAVSYDDASTLAMDTGPVARLGTCAGWAFAVEHWSAEGAQGTSLVRTSQDTEVVVLLNSGTPPRWFSYARGGEVVSTFGPGVEAAQQGGTDPAYLVAAQPEAGLLLPDGTSTPDVDDEHAVLTMAERHFALDLPRDALTNGTLPAVLLQPREFVQSSTVNPMTPSPTPKIARPCPGASS